MGVYYQILKDSNSSEYTYDGIVNILSKPIITPLHKIFVLHEDESVDYELPPEDIVSGSINYAENYQQGQRRTLSFDLRNPDGKYSPSSHGLWIDTKFRYDMGVSYNGNQIWFRKGVFVVTSPTDTHVNSNKTITFQLSDKFAILSGKMGSLSISHVVKANSKIFGVIDSTLKMSTGKGYITEWVDRTYTALDPIMFTFDIRFKDSVTPYTIVKDANTPISELFIDFAEILGSECFYNEIGSLCYVSIDEASADRTKPEIWNYKRGSMDYSGSVDNYDYENVYNYVVVTCDSIYGTPVTATSYNTLPESPICIQRIGRRVQAITDQNIGNASGTTGAAIYLAQQRATYELRKSALVNIQNNASVSYNPLLEVNSLIRITDDERGWDNEAFIIQSINYSSGDIGKMNISMTQLGVMDFATYQTPIVGEL